MLGLTFLEIWFIITASSLLTFIFFVNEEAEKGDEYSEYTDQPKSSK